jgi:hypothetical protein
MEHALLDCLDNTALMSNLFFLFLRTYPAAPPYPTPSPKWGKISTIHCSSTSHITPSILWAVSRRPKVMATIPLPHPTLTNGVVSRGRAQRRALQPRRQNLRWGGGMMWALLEPAPVAASPSRTGSPYLVMGELELLVTA